MCGDISRLTYKVGVGWCKDEFLKCRMKLIEGGFERVIEDAMLEYRIKVRSELDVLQHWRDVHGEVTMGHRGVVVVYRGGPNPRQRYATVEELLEAACSTALRFANKLMKERNWDIVTVLPPYDSTSKPPPYKP